MAGSGTLLFPQGRQRRFKMTLGLKMKCQLQAGFLMNVVQMFLSDLFVLMESG